MVVPKKILFNVNPASWGGHKADGVSKGEKRKLSPLVEHGDSNPVFDITWLNQILILEDSYE